jgi:hypothetical protein
MVHEFQNAAYVAAQDQAPVQAEGGVYHRGFDELVAVLIPTDPRAEFEHVPQARCLLGKQYRQFVLELPVRFERSGDEGMLEEKQGPLYLLDYLRAADSQRVRLPEDCDLLGKALLQSPSLPPGKRRRLKARQRLPDALVLATDAPACGLHRASSGHASPTLSLSSTSCKRPGSIPSPFMRESALATDARWGELSGDDSYWRRLRTRW